MSGGIKMTLSQYPVMSATCLKIILESSQKEFSHTSLVWSVHELIALDIDANKQNGSVTKRSVFGLTHVLDK